MASPAKRMRLSSQRQSLSSSINVSANILNVSQNTLRSADGAGTNKNRSAAYDIITGEPIQPTKPRQQSISQLQLPTHPLRKSVSQVSLEPQKPMVAVPQQKYHDDTLALQARINKLEYEVRNLDGERSLLTLQHEKELREIQARADLDHRRYQDAEAERLKAVRLHETAVKEVRDIRDRGANDSATIEKRARELQSQCEVLQEEREDFQSRLSDAERELRRVQVEEVEGARSRLERTMQESAAELDEMRSRFDTINTKLLEKEHYAEDLEKKLLELNNKTGGGEELGILRKEFSDHMDTLRNLESLEREQRSKIRRLEEERRSVNVVQEEKKSLEVQIQVLKLAERRANEIELQKEILEDEKRMWTSLLEKEADDDQREFDTPEAVVKALVNERIQYAMALERLGAAESEVIGKDEAVRALEGERNSLKQRLEEVSQHAAAQPELESRSVQRMEGQYQLARKEIEYLKAQLETFHTEAESIAENTNFDAQRAQQVQDLESLVTEYKSEIETLQHRIITLESLPPSTPAVGQKRKVEDADQEQLGHILRKNKNLQVALQKTSQQSQMLAKELQASKSQLKALRSTSRILELKDNPTAQYEAIKADTLRVLKQENTELMLQLRGDAALNLVRMVPVSSFDAIKLDLQAKDVVIADLQKHLRRQREIWTARAAEFREAIASILGYNVMFLQNGKVRVTSLYYKPSSAEEEIDEDDRQDYIELDGEKNTIRFGGGGDGPLAEDVQESFKYWVGEKRDIPCFFAALTLDFYERYGGVTDTS